MKRPQIVNLTLEDLGGDAECIERYIDSLEEERGQLRARVAELDNAKSAVPGSYAQYGEPAGSLMWDMHRAITRLEKERDQLQVRVAELEESAKQIFKVKHRDGSYTILQIDVDQLRGVLTSTPAQSLARVKAEALRGYAEAADLGVRRSEGDVEWFSLDGRWLREEADRLEAEAGE